jgi:hypothetical protein
MSVLPHVRPSTPIPLDKFSWNLVLGTSMKIRHENLSLVEIVQNYRALDRKISLFLILLVATYTRSAAIWKMHLSFHGKVYIIYYIFHSNIRVCKTTVHKKGNFAFRCETRLPRTCHNITFYVPYVPTYTYETKPEVWPLLIPILLLFTVRIHLHLFPFSWPTYQTYSPTIFPS